MKHKNLLFLSLSLSNVLLSIEKTIDKKKHSPDLEVIAPACKEDLKNFLSKISNQKEIKQKLGIDLNSLENYDTNKFYPPIYIVDINNDNKDEYVSVDTQGSGGYLSIKIFSEINGEIKELEMPNNVELDHGYNNPFTGHKEYFVRAQNKIYILGDSYSHGLSRDIYLLQNNKMVRACDKFWIAQQRKLFDQLYAKKLYKSAFSLLNKFEKDCRFQIEPQTDLSIRKDVALACMKSGSLKQH